jgi:hypothetical protein
MPAPKVKLINKLRSIFTQIHKFYKSDLLRGQGNIFVINKTISLCKKVLVNVKVLEKEDPRIYLIDNFFE